MAGFRDLIVYQKAFKLAMLVFTITKRFPKEEIYSLTDQVRRSSRSTAVNMAEAYRKKRYRAHFVSKLTDADTENTETQVHLDFAVACGYLTQADIAPLVALSEEVGYMLASMMENPEKFTDRKT
ncbi:MAG: four helix bundle protein [Flavobacteriales bacterium]|nr:four helix bundle protein [Flavobacteriales bacterium]